jgi:hypothetical protein
MDKLLAQNESRLKKAGIEPTAANLYLAHFLGAGGAVNALLNPDAPVSAKVQAANPFAAGWTNADLAKWAANKMGGGAATFGSSLFPTDEQHSEPALTVEGTLKAAGVDLNAPLGEDVKEFQPGQRIDVTQADKTVPGTVQEVYGQGPSQGVKVALDDGTTFDEEVARARQYGAKLTQPAAPVSNAVGSAPDVAVPEAAQPAKPYAGAKIDNEYTAFHRDTGTLGIPRAEMPQIKQEDRGAAVNFFEARGISAEHDTVPATSLKPTQAEFAPAKVQKFLDQDSGERSVLVSSDGYVLDGHHQYVAALDRGGDVKVIRLGAPIRKLLEAAHAFPSSQRSEGASQVQPDMFGGEAQTAEQLDARRLAPRVLREVTKDNRLDDLWDATDYVLRRSQKTSAGPGDIGQSVREFNKITGRNLNRKEATAYALELERLRDSGETGKPKTKSAAGPERHRARLRYDRAPRPRGMAEGGWRHSEDASR